MTIGEKIKMYREANNLTQKQVALRAGMSEPAIRNYELGNRTPSPKQIEKIAMALNVSPFAISNPDLNSYVGVMHALFYLEKEYGLYPDEVDGEICLKFKNKYSCESENVKLWYEEYQAMQSAPEEELSSAVKHYEEWESSFPRLSAEMNKKALMDRRTKKNNN